MKKKFLVISLVLLVATIGSPIIINTLYMIGSDKPNTVFDASHLLAYAGACIFGLAVYGQSHNMHKKPCTFVHFRPRFRYIEKQIKPTFKDERANKYTLAGDIASKREKLPLLRTHDITNADIILYQLSEVFAVKMDNRWAWFPLMYVYFKSEQQLWSKMVSKRHCENLYPLFGVDSIAKLKESVKRNPHNEKIRHSYDSYAPSILDNVEIDKIGTMP